MHKKRLSILFGLALFLVCYMGSAKAQEWMPKRIVGMDYPELAASAKVQGQVEISCTIKPDGSVVSAEVIGTAQPLLSDYAKENAMKWLFLDKNGSGQLGTFVLRYTFSFDGNLGHFSSQFVFEYPNRISISTGYRLVRTDKSE